MKRLKQLRIEKGKTQKELAKYLNVSQQTVSRYENQKVISMPTDLLEKLANYYKVSIDFILADNEPGELTEKKNIEGEVLEILSCLNSYNKETLLIVGKRLLTIQQLDDEDKWVETK